MDAAQSPRRGTVVVYQFAGAVALLGIWAALSYGGLVGAFVLPAPDAAFASLIEGWSDGSLVPHVLTTAREFGLALGASILLGIAFGVGPGLVPAIHRSIGPLIGLALSVPIVTYFAFLVVLFGYGFWSVVALGIVAATPVMLVSTITAFDKVDPILMRVGRTYCVKRWPIFRRVLLPSALATLASGVRIAAGRVLIGVIVGEMFMSSRGLGALIVRATGFFDIPRYYGVLLTLAGFSYLVAALFSSIENRMTRFST